MKNLHKSVIAILIMATVLTECGNSSLSLRFFKMKREIMRETEKKQEI